MVDGDNSSAIRKITLRLVLPLAVLLLLNSIDRVNISFAALRMNAELGLTPQSYGLAVSLFFVGYLAFQIPSLLLLKRYGMRRWLFCCSLIWGIAATASAFVATPAALGVIRVVLGAAEGGFAPGLVYYLTHWMPSRYRATAISKVMVAVPASVIIGGPLSGWLMSISNPLHMAGWRWMLLVEGIPTVLLAVSVLWLFADSPRLAGWLHDTERSWIENQLSGELTVRTAAVPATGLMLSSQFWAAALCWFSLMSGAYGLLYWLPQVIKQFPGVSDMQAGLLSSLPWAAAAVGMVANSRHSDCSGERHWHVGLATIASGSCMALALLPATGLPALLLLSLAGLGFGAGQSPFWTIPSTFLSAGAAAAGIAVINMAGNSAGIVGPVLIGWLRQRTGSFDSPVIFMAALLVVGGATLILLRPRPDGRRHR
jgi:ACS family tartrate transporter-like MFS transporter